jgi:hypothetical protein
MVVVVVVGSHDGVGRRRWLDELRCGCNGKGVDAMGRNLEKVWKKKERN